VLSSDVLEALKQAEEMISESLPDQSAVLSLREDADDVCDVCEGVGIDMICAGHDGVVGAIIGVCDKCHLKGEAPKLLTSMINEIRLTMEEKN